MGKMVETENLICLKDQSTVKKRRIQFYTHFFQRWNKLGEHLLRIFLSFCLQRAFNFLSYHVASRFSIHFEILLLNPQSDTSKIASRQKAKKMHCKEFLRVCLQGRDDRRHHHNNHHKHQPEASAVGARGSPSSPVYIHPRAAPNLCARHVQWLRYCSRRRRACHHHVQPKVSLLLPLYQPGPARPGKLPRNFL